MRSVAALFDQVARATPDAIAVVQRGRPALTYRELEIRSRRLARELIDGGAGPGSFVGLAASRSVEAVVAILGIVRSGSAYVPLDAAYPDTQLALMLADTRPPVVLADRAMSVRLAQGTLAAASGHCALRPIGGAVEADGGSENLAVMPGPQDPVYVMYTSGSTGRPKGVVVPNRAVCRLVSGQDYCDLGPDAVVLQLAPLSFDASTFEIWAALLNGGTLAIVADDRPTVDRIAEAIGEHAVNTAWLTAGLFHLMVDSAVDRIADLRQLLAGGDVLSPDHVRRFAAAAPGCRLINGYGPTENTTFTCCADLSGIDWPYRNVPIGRAIAGTGVHIVDADLVPVRAGEAGQLVASGEGLAIGYLGLPELTAEKFVEAPAPIGERIYLTGDLARELPDGQIEFLGRMDRQIKIDGKRVEPGEIEQALRACDGVSDAAVVVETAGSGVKRLRAFVAVGDAAFPTGKAIASRAAASVRTSLPEYLWPSRIDAVASLPVTANGKVDRGALLATADTSSPAAGTGEAGLEEAVAEIWRKVLGLGQIGPDEVFFELGGRSLQMMAVHSALQERLGRSIAISDLFARPTIRGLSTWLSGKERRAERKTGQRSPHSAAGFCDIAIIGMAGRFPGAASVEEFWANQKAGAISITRFDDADLADSFDAETRGDPNFVRARGVLTDPGQFDAALFGMLPREAAQTDPQHRVFLEVALQTIERAGLDPATYPGKVGVFAGASMPTYLIRNLLDTQAEARDFASNYQLGAMQTLVGSLPDALATRVAYKLDLHGPAMTVQSACSTSAVAVVQACQSLQLGHCDAALAGGVSITFPQERGYLYMNGGMGSRDGTCRPLDAEASGTVFGGGAAAILLKRLDDALAEGDTIYAVIKGYGINNDGAEKGSFTAPNARGQADAIASALECANVDPATIGYVELHGTATPLGDPIEVDGLAQAFGAKCPQGGCILGSAKANIGHLDVAAGVTGLIKAALCLHDEAIPPLANYNAPNPELGLAGSAFRVERELSAWPRGDTPRRAGVSSFGVGGTNVHIVLEEAPRAAHREPREGLQILPLSAKTAAARDAMAVTLADHLDANPELALADVAFTLSQGRQARGERAAVVAADRGEAVAGLRTLGKRGIRASAGHEPPVVFMFPGQGSQYPGMGAGLYRGEPVFREWIDSGADRIGTRLGTDLRRLLYDVDAAQGDEHPIRATVNAQPALFVTQHALAQLWISRGVRPSAMVGHSVGEFVAATLSGALSFENAIELVVKRAELMQSAPRGAMLVVRTSEQELTALLGDRLAIAAFNAPTLCVASGPFDAMDELMARLDARQIEYRHLHTSHAFHSAMMDPVVEDLARFAATMTFAEPAVPFVSCVSGDWASGDLVGEGAYWARHCRAPVRFADALATLVRDSKPILLEVGAGQTLSTFAALGLEKGSYLAAVTSMPGIDDAGRDREAFFEAAARLWALGIAPDWRDLHGPDARRVPLPAYQFQRQNYWIEPRALDPAPVPEPQSAGSSPSVSQPPSIGNQPAPSEGFESTMTIPARITRLRPGIAALLEDISGEAIDPAEWSAPFLELGFDSLLLGQVAGRVQREFGVKVTFRQLMNDLSTLEALAGYLDAEMPADARPGPAETVKAPIRAPAPIAAAATPADPGTGGLQDLFQMQLSAMQGLIDRQLDVLRTVGGQGAAGPVAPPAPASAPLAPRVEAPLAAAETPAPEAGGRFRPFDPRSARAEGGPDDRQAAFIADLCARYGAKMPGSKAQTQQHRGYFADPRSAAGFRPEWKELVFPVVAARSKGSKIWDVDGNEFIDLVNGYGQTAFGHAPDFVVEAVSRQLEQGFAIGPQSPLAGKVAARLSRILGMERVTFCNTGSEAVMAAMRVARCVSGRDKVVVFANDYHGQFDEVLVKSGGKSSFARAFPIAPGIPGDSVSNMVVLPYGAPQSLDWIRDNANDLAAVIVEPVQSRHPELLPFDFLRDLRALTADGDIAMVFDEVVTGFRTHPGGMQAVLGIRADMATYGKVLGGGMPIGVLAGAARYLDALDGGVWQFGDASFPEVAPTFFAGTFVRHPLVLAACDAVLDHVEAEGAQLQHDLAERTAGLVRRINGVLADKGVPVEVRGYSSWFMLDLSGAHRFAPLFQAHMRLLGIHVLDGYPCFLTTAHSDADIDRIVEAVVQTLDALQGVGILLPEGGKLPESNDRPAHGPVSIPLTEPQLEILLSAQMGPAASCAYNESMTVEFAGPIDAALLVAAVNDFIARHDAVRGILAAGVEQMTFAPSLTIELPVVDGDDDLLAAIKAEEATGPFDLQAGPLVRGRIVRLPGDRTALVFTAHHIVFDGWSANVFVNEVAEFYRARKEGRAPVLEPVLSFGTFAQGKTAASGLSAEDESFWRAAYASLPEPLSLPADRPRLPTKSFAGASLTGFVDAGLARSVKQAGARRGCTLFGTLFAALQVTIGRLAESEDVVLGCPTAGQALVDDTVLVGHCVNFLPLRVPFRMDQSIGEHMVTVGQSLQEAFDHQDVTYGALVRALEVPRNPNRTPLTDVQFNLERLGEGIDFGGVDARLIPNPKAAVNFDLFFNMVESDAGLRIDVDYSTDLFDAETVERWIENLRQVLRAIAADSTQQIAGIVLSGAEEQAWLAARNPEAPRLSDDSSIVSLFRRAAATYADRVALVADGETLSYAALEARSNQLAKALIARGIGKGDLVSLLSGRSIAAIEMILAVLKTGAAYVPLDPSYPPARQEYVLQDCDARLVLFGPGGEEASALLDCGERGLSYAALRDEASGLSDAPPPVEVHADDPAYIMYTSGSTGRPKGVVVPHRGVVRLVVDQDFVTLGPDETLLLLTALGFDVCQFEIWGALFFGGKLAIATAAKPSLDEISQIIVENGVTVAVLAAALFHMIVEERVEALAPLKQLIATADVVSRTLVRRAQEALPHLRLVNGYGPTENSCFTTCYVFPAEGWGPGSSPIGKPLARSSALIMDPRGRVSPKGAVGELWTGGEGLAIGYFGKPELTAERFVPDPRHPGELVYRTGDYARWRNDGAIEFLGRIDGQLKINGMRVELDEIEAVLCEAEGIREAAVTVRDTASGSKTVHAFVTLSQGRDGKAYDPGAVSRLVVERLPAHMQPRTVQVLDAMPLNANGKVDRGALRDLIGNAPSRPAPVSVVRKSSEVEAAEGRISAIWREVLGVSGIEPTDAIFDLGADSLQIFRISARMADKGMRLENRHLLANPTLAQVATLVVEGTSDGAPRPAAITPLSAYRGGAMRGGGA